MLEPPSVTMQRPGRIVETITTDGLRLHGFWQTADLRRLALESNVSDPAMFRIDGDPSVLRSQGRLWVVVHGVSGNFYSSTLLESISSLLIERGDDVCRINTRGRDPMAFLTTRGGATRLGSAYETVHDFPIDLAAWLEFFRQLGYRRFGLLGHSLGAVKIALWLAPGKDTEGIEGVVLLSPPRLNATVLASDPQYGVAFVNDLSRARVLIDRSAPEELMSIRYPQPMFISAATFLDKYGHESQYDFATMAPLLSVATLWCYGELEVRGPRASFRDSDRLIHELVGAMPNHRLEVIPQGDHSYSAARPALFDAIQRWLSEH